jgi:AMMECR1 domain-containing protein
MLIAVLMELLSRAGRFAAVEDRLRNGPVPHPWRALRQRSARTRRYVTIEKEAYMKAITVGGGIGGPTSVLGCSDLMATAAAHSHTSASTGRRFGAGMGSIGLGHVNTP